MHFGAKGKPKRGDTYDMQRLVWNSLIISTSVIILDRQTLCYSGKAKENLRRQNLIKKMKLFRMISIKFPGAYFLSEVLEGSLLEGTRSYF